MGLSLKGILRGAGKVLKSPVGGLASKFIPGLGAISTGLTIAGAIGGLRKKRAGTPGINPNVPGGGPMTPESRLEGAMDRAGGQAFGNAGYEGLRDFDPESAFEKYVGGAEERFKGQLSRGLEGIVGSSVGSGRLNSGYLDLDVRPPARL
jgi:hypothetical protein